jgi:hypothetical protein
MEMEADEKEGGICLIDHSDQNPNAFVRPVCRTHIGGAIDAAPVFAFTGHWP